MTWRKVLVRTAIGMLVLFVALQLVPYGWTRSNPPITQAATWPDAETEALARGACYDCHSNETAWPAYSYVAPMSWFVRGDVDNGREVLNLSELDADGDKKLDEAAEVIADGSMPPSQYRLMHPDARLSDAEQRRLIEAFERLDAGDDREDGSGPG